MTEEPFIAPDRSTSDEIAAADPGQGAPREAAGAGDPYEPDVFPEPDPEGDTLDEELRDRPTPPFRTPHPEESADADRPTDR